MMWVKRIGVAAGLLFLLDQVTDTLGDWQTANQKRFEAAVEGLR